MLDLCRSVAVRWICLWIAAWAIQEVAASCPPPPTCGSTPTIRAWVPKIGKWERTCDGGVDNEQWTTDCLFSCIGPTAQREYYAASFPDGNTGYMVGQGGLLVKSSDAGTNWDQGVSGTLETIYGVHFTSASNGWLVGGGSQLGHTLDGGDTWIWREDLAELSGGNILYGVHFHNQSIGWLVGTAGRIYKTTNAGADWRIQTYTIGQTFYGVHFSSDLSAGVVVGADGLLLWYNGRTWIQQDSNTTADLKAAYVINGTHAVAVGFAGALIQTTDAGVTWERHPEAEPEMFFYGVRFASPLIGWVVGTESADDGVTAGPGVLLATQDGGMTWTRNRRVGLIHQRLHAVTSHTHHPPACPPEATTNTATTTLNALALALQDTEMEALTVVSSSGQRKLKYNTTGANISAQAIRLSEATGGFVPVEGVSSGVKVPSKLLLDVGGEAVVVITEYSGGDRPAWDSNPAAQESMESGKGMAALYGQPVGVNFGVNGNFVPVHGLEQGMYIKISDTTIPGYECGFWNETTLAWDPEGVTTFIDKSDGSTWCVSTHLSVFGMVANDILRGIIKAAVCHKVDVMSKKGLDKLEAALFCKGNHCLWTSPVFILYWLFLIGALTVMIWGRHRDKSWKGAKLWNARCFLTQNPNFRSVKGDKVDELMDLVDMAREKWNNLGEFLALLVSTRLIQHAVAGKLCVSVAELRVLLEWAQKTALNYHLESKVKGKSADSRNPEFDRAKLVSFIPIIHQALKTETELFRERFSSGKPVFEQMRYVFSSLNPVVKLSHFSIMRPTIDAALLILLKVCGAQLTAALFFQGGATDANDDPRCAPPSSLGERFGTAFGVSILSVCIGTVPVKILNIMIKRKFIYKEEWTEEDTQKQIFQWKVKRVVFWALSMAYVIFSIFFCLAFLGNITAQDSSKWAISAFFVLLKVSLLIPFALSLTLIIVSAVAGPRWQDEELMDKAKAWMYITVDPQKVKPELAKGKRRAKRNSAAVAQTPSPEEEKQGLAASPAIVGAAWEQPTQDPVSGFTPAAQSGVSTPPTHARSAGAPVEAADPSPGATPGVSVSVAAARVLEGDRARGAAGSEGLRTPPRGRAPAPPGPDAMVPPGGHRVAAGGGFTTPPRQVPPPPSGGQRGAVSPSPPRTLG